MFAVAQRSPTFFLSSVPNQDRENLFGDGESRLMKAARLERSWQSFRWRSCRTRFGAGEEREMTDSGELKGIKQLLSLLIQQVGDLTIQTTELMPQKHLTQGYQQQEQKSAELLTTRMRKLHILAGKILGIEGRLEDS